MHLKLENLRRVVDKTRAEEKNIDVLREEISRVLGPSVCTDVNLKLLAEHANDRIDVLLKTDRADVLKFEPSIILRFVDNPMTEVRKFAARVLPLKHAQHFIYDKDSSVRVALARRLPLRCVAEMLERDPFNDELLVIACEKRLSEGEVPEPKKRDDHDAHGKTRSRAFKQKDTPDMSDAWYDTLAHKFIQDYSGNMEGQWDELIADRYSRSVKATTGIDIDKDKLYKAINDQLDAKDDRTLERFSLKECINTLRKCADCANIEETIVDPVQELINANLSSTEYIARANSLFNIKESMMPQALRKYCTSASLNGKKIPCIGHVPGNAVRFIDECALDAYVKHWNDYQTMHGEPLRLKWTHGPSSVGAISFGAELK